MAFSTDNIGKNCYINISEDENIQDSLYGTIIGYYKNTDKNEEYYFVSINGNVIKIYDDSLVNIVDDGGSVTPGSLITVSEQMTEEQAAQFRENVGAVSIDEIGTVFRLKGGVATVADLPTTGNTVGDVYYVQDVSAGYIWLTSDSQPNGYWEELGETFNITIDSELSTTSENPVQNKVISLALAEKGTYSKPSGGIPKSDLASSVQTSLGKADTALQTAPVTSVNGKTGAVVLSASDVGAAPLQLTATPTSGPSGNTLMSGTWSGATWEEVVAAVQASRLIQIDVANVGKITLLYNMGSATNAVSNTVPYADNGVLYTVAVELFIAGGNGRFSLSIINASTKTVNISGTTPTIIPAANTIYNCGELTSLTISNPPASGAYSIVFTSGATATTTTFPATVLGLEDFAAEANTVYEINVLDNRAVVGSWAVSA